MDQPQGTLVDCVYCSRVRPGPATECPRCAGATPAFRPARMMDGESSRAFVLDALWDVADERRRHREGGAAGKIGASERYRERLLGLLENTVIYGFDLAEALSEEIRRVEDSVARP